MKTIIEINGEDKTREIKDYYIDNANSLIFIQFISNNKYYNYSKSKVRISPIIVNSLSDDELVVYHSDYEYKYIKEAIEYKNIGDKVILVVLPDKNIYYKSKYINIEKLKEYSLNEEQYVLVKGKISKVNLLEFSEHFARVQFAGTTNQYVYNREDIQVKEHCNIRFSNVLNYYKEIAKIKDIHIADEVDEYLEKQIKDMIIEKETALNAFLSKKNQSYCNNKQKIYPFGINLSQRDAILNAGKYKISLIQGPPGTGKTQSILNIIANCIIQNQTIAVVSSNNEAIKNVKEKMEKDNYGFFVSLLGKKENKEFFFNNQPEYPEELFGWKKSRSEMEQLLTEISKHENTLTFLLENKNTVAELNQKIFEYQHEHFFFKEYMQNHEVAKLKKFNFFKLDKEKILELLFILNIHIDEEFKILEKISFFLKYGVYNFQQFNNIDSIILDLQDKYYKTAINDLENKREILTKELNNHNFDDEIEQLTLKSQEYFKAYLSSQFFKSQNRRKFSPDTYFYDNEFTEFIKEYPVIISTTHAISKSIMHGYLFDYLIVDEASQVELVPGIIALNTAKRAVIVGDLNQLPHIPEELIKKQQYDEWHDLYSIPIEFNYKMQSLLSSCDMIFANEGADVLLKEHYRCHNKIITFCNKKYYNNKLICHSNVSCDKPLVLLRTVEGNHMRYGENAVNKITNIRELESLVDKDFMTEMQLDINSNKSFGFIAPFRGQVNSSKDILPSEFQKDTVHKFQGRECNVVMFSSVLDKKMLSKQRLNFVDEPHLINVAVSRAIEKFILVSNVDIFKENKGDINDLIRYMEYYEEDSTLYQSNVRSIFDLLYSDYSELLKSKKQLPGWKISENDSENIVHELLQSIFLDKSYDKYKYQSEVKIKEILRELSKLDTDEMKYVHNNASIDFLVYNKFDNQPILAIEVDGYQFHENNPKQLIKDKMKDSILTKYNIPIFRLKTNYSNEETIKKICEFL